MNKQNSITGCFEGQPRYYQTIEEVLAETRLMDDVSWLIKLCVDRQLCR
ncbi:MAG: hypothetical protein KIT27_04955 [Legionellales bacterium]|nr:hypothetical protein [Legionellales bacterium]